MGKKLADGTFDDPCLANVKVEEPIFVLRAQDKLAPEMIDLWADRALLLGCPSKKIDEAKATAQAMRDWGKKHGAKYPD